PVEVEALAHAISALFPGRRLLLAREDDAAAEHAHVLHHHVAARSHEGRHVGLEPVRHAAVHGGEGDDGVDAWLGQARQRYLAGVEFLVDELMDLTAGAGRAGAGWR
ncbi:MAG: hypothetical protein ACK55I_32520, partial [bacterium]